jgi:hypothetical protein
MPNTDTAMAIEGMSASAGTGKKAGIGIFLLMRCFPPLSIAPC